MESEAASPHLAGIPGTYRRNRWGILNSVTKFSSRHALENFDIIGMWETIKQILSKNSGTCIIIEEGKPAYVITRFEEYQKILERKGGDKEIDFIAKGRSGLDEQELLEKINQEINNWKTKQGDSETETSVLDEDESDEGEDLKIENLPIT